MMSAHLSYFSPRKYDSMGKSRYNMNFKQSLASKHQNFTNDEIPKYRIMSLRRNDALESLHDHYYFHFTPFFNTESESCIPS